jgi:hypothetical protein
MEVLPPSTNNPFGWLAAINWGHGMIGKATVAVVALVVLLAILAIRIPSSQIIWIAIIGLVAVFGYLGFLEYFVSRHPDIAATEGPTYVQSKQIGLAAKGVPKLPYDDVVPDPQNPTLLEPNKTNLSEAIADG